MKKGKRIRAAARKVFRGMGKFLTKQAIAPGPSADELIRKDRDGRGW